MTNREQIIDALVTTAWSLPAWGDAVSFVPVSARMWNAPVPRTPRQCRRLQVRFAKFLRHQRRSYR